MPDGTTLLVALALAVVPTLLYLVVLNALDRYEKEPWTILLACVGAGAIAGPILVLAVFAVLGRALMLPPAFAPGVAPDAVIAIVEEVVLGLLLLLVVRLARDEFDDVLDGVIYGAAVGAGFAATETFLYAIGGVERLTPSTLLTLMVAGLNHAFYLAVFGAIVGWSQELPPARRWTTIVLGLATVALLQALHDTLPQILANVLGRPEEVAGLLSRGLVAVVDWLGLLTLAVIIVAAWRREARVLRAELRDEVAAGVVSPEDYATITSLRGRLGRQARLARTGGVGAARQLRRRYALEGELAFHRRRVQVSHRRPPDPARGDRLRARLLELRDPHGEVQP